MTAALPPRQPGSVAAASVLAFVTAGVLLSTTPMVLFIAAFQAAWDPNSTSTALGLAAVADLTTAGLLIAAGVGIMRSGNLTAYRLYLAGAVLVAVQALCWVAWAWIGSGPQVLVGAVVYVGLVGVGFALVSRPDARQWLAPSR